MTKKLERYEMMDVQAALIELKKRADFVDLYSSLDGWSIECKYQEDTLTESHDNIWYLVNHMLDVLRGKLVFDHPEPGPEFKTGTWREYDVSFIHKPTCRCGAYAAKIRGWAQTGTPCRKSEFECKHGHRWTSTINCD